MSWITIILVMMSFSIMFIFGKLYFKKYTNGRMNMDFLSVSGFIIFVLISLVYSVENSKTIKVIEIEPSFYAKSKTTLYLEFDTLGYQTSYKYETVKKYNEINETTKFYLCEYVNLWNNHFQEIHATDYYIGLEDKELNKTIKNRW